MKIFVFATIAIAALSAVEAFEQASVHLRVHGKGACTITNESQCNGQNWTGSTCCADSSYECRWSDDGQNVQRCQKKKGSSTPSIPSGPGTTPVTPSGGGGNVGDWGDCNGGKKCQNPSSVCVKHSNYYSQCKPAMLPAGALCGQNDGTNVWKYEKCPSNQKCAPMGSDFRCSNKKHHKKHHKKVAQKYGSCTITNESQCNGQNWTGSTCCADSRYECRWSDDGQNVQRCQKKKWKKQQKKIAQKTDPVSDYTDVAGDYTDHTLPDDNDYTADQNDDTADQDDDTTDDYDDTADQDDDTVDHDEDTTDDYDDTVDQTDDTIDQTDDTIDQTDDTADDYDDNADDYEDSDSPSDNDDADDYSA